MSQPNLGRAARNFGGAAANTPQAQDPDQLAALLGQGWQNPGSGIVAPPLPGTPGGPGQPRPPSYGPGVYQGDAERGNLAPDDFARRMHAGARPEDVNLRDLGRYLHPDAAAGMEAVDFRSTGGIPGVGVTAAPVSRQQDLQALMAMGQHAVQNAGENRQWQLGLGELGLRQEDQAARNGLAAEAENRQRAGQNYTQSQTAFLRDLMRIRGADPNANLRNVVSDVGQMTRSPELNRTPAPLPQVGVARPGGQYGNVPGQQGAYQGGPPAPAQAGAQPPAGGTAPAQPGVVPELAPPGPQEARQQQLRQLWEDAARAHGVRLNGQNAQPLSAEQAQLLLPQFVNNVPQDLLNGNYMDVHNFMSQNVPAQHLEAWYGATDPYGSQSPGAASRNRIRAAQNRASPGVVGTRPQGPVGLAMENTTQMRARLPGTPQRRVGPASGGGLVGGMGLTPEQLQQLLQQGGQ